MKLWMKIILGIVAAIAILIGVIFYATSGITERADQFFAAVKTGDIHKAHGFLSEAFKKTTDEAALERYLRANALTDFAEANWGQREVNLNGGGLSGSIKTTSGGTVPIQLKFVKENGDWKIYSLMQPAAGLQTNAKAPAPPDEGGQVALVRQSIHDFFVSVSQKDMTHFRSTVSQLWQGQHDVAFLNDAFESFFPIEANWAVLDNKSPIFAQAGSVNENGVLTISGHYDTSPAKVYFEQEYIYEGLSWKLLAFNIQVK
ncbi:MAG: hypothetical protein KDG50_05115 [Chromatiales bacterium]|nr:hypothetical protein [Chromatiales bacterium]